MKKKVTLIDLKANQCRWPIGDPKKSEFCFCGATAQKQPYCEEHRRIAYQQRKQKEDENE